MDILRRLNDQVTRALLVLAAVLAFLLCFLVVADVVGRVVFNSPVKGTTEIVSLSIVVICYLQAGFAIRSGGMLHVDMFVSRGGPRTQSAFAALLKKRTMTSPEKMTTIQQKPGGVKLFSVSLCFNDEGKDMIYIMKSLNSDYSAEQEKSSKNNVFLLFFLFLMPMTTRVKNSAG